MQTTTDKRIKFRRNNGKVGFIRGLIYGIGDRSWHNRKISSLPVVSQYHVGHFVKNAQRRNRIGVNGN